MPRYYTALNSSNAGKNSRGARTMRAVSRLIGTLVCRLQTDVPISVAALLLGGADDRAASSAKFFDPS
jgi:hypothetical protein